MTAVAKPCDHWDTASGLCEDEPTRRYLIGQRCQLHAPGATGLACPHGVAWIEPCERCANVWGDPLEG